MQDIIQLGRETRLHNMEVPRDEYNSKYWSEVRNLQSKLLLAEIKGLYRKGLLVWLALSVTSVTINVQDELFTTTFSAWSLSLVEREESLKISLYFALACVRGAPSRRHLAVPIIYAVTEEEPARYSTPLSRSVGARIPNRSIPPALKDLVGTVVGAALRAGMLQEPAVARSGRNPV